MLTNNFLYFPEQLFHSDLDQRALDALKEFPPDSALGVLATFLESDLKHVSNKSAYFCDVMKTYRFNPFYKPPITSSRSSLDDSKKPPQDLRNIRIQPKAEKRKTNNDEPEIVVLSSEEEDAKEDDNEADGQPTAKKPLQESNNKVSNTLTDEPIVIDLAIRDDVNNYNKVISNFLTFQLFDY